MFYSHLLIKLWNFIEPWTEFQIRLHNFSWENLKNHQKSNTRIINYPKLKRPKKKTPKIKQKQLESKIFI